MLYTKKPKQFTTYLVKKGKKGRKYVNKRGDMTSIGVKYNHHIINMGYKENCRLHIEKSIELTPDEVGQMRKELNTDYNIWHIPAKDIISVLKKWGKI